MTVQLRERFRLPDREAPAPRPARLVGVCGWAAGLGLLGLPIAARASIAMLTERVPGWFEPAVVSVGVLGIVLTAATFATLHRRRLPWLLLTTATGLLGLNAALVFLV